MNTMINDYTNTNDFTRQICSDALKHVSQNFS